MLQTNQNNGDYFLKDKIKRILVVEPSNINWISLKNLVDGFELDFCRVSKVAEAKNKIDEFNPDVILFTTLSRGTDYLSLLAFLSDIGSNHQKIYSVIWLQHDMEWMAQLFHAFGVSAVFVDPVNSYEIEQFLLGDSIKKNEKRTCLLGLQERLTALALLQGESVTTISHRTGKNVRTISTQKKAIIKKLNMETNEELYLFAGKLAYLSKVSREV
ncbi:DNA-binding NarL/FixJ family response regulator [Serratia fonticola]|uniref:DNA-binding NarL/FixJ family response regulator n=1 Tax=Serratia fonticola TaxID=47917 RepID=A0A542BK66_SERFO|nr:response regulator transcription factor [Serratia fonticola]TQI78926.1 DNA-binding NarL/FixJ family response regulator [Serratia fonticola]TQI99051.1 DNA-binding NarL/FixJ family response regulator [Serratia fonticola]TVZ68576.1 DNA-binding NarL/FixJ family response regulator [Serratia fonticola]